MIKTKFDGAEMDLDVAINLIIKQTSEDIEKGTKLAIKAGAEVLKKNLIAKTPVSTKIKKNADSDTQTHMKDSWQVSKVRQKKFAQMVQNTKKVRYNETNKNDGTKKERFVPLSTLIEYSEKGKPFITSTYIASEQEIYDKIVETLEREVTKK